MITTSKSSSLQSLNLQHKENLPNASKLINSLRHLDYDTISAICDIVDNSIDANSSQIWVNILPGKRIESIEIIDDGNGMSQEILDQALRLGSETGKNPMCDLGLYGMGLITASISLGRRLTIITKEFDAEIIRGIQDLDLIAEKNEFTKILETVNEKEAETFSNVIVDLKNKNKTKEDSNKQGNSYTSGTIVRIENIDRCEWRDGKALSEALGRKIGQIFRKFIQADKCNIYVNGIGVKAIDPINDLEPNLLNEEIIPVEDSEINIRISEAKDYGAEINKENGLNIANQGFYIIRNHREISAGETLGIFTKHNDFNRLRIELSYSAVIDGLLNTNFSKQKIKLDQSVKNKVERACCPFLRQVRNNSRQKQKDSRQNRENYSDVEKYISKKAHLLKTPQAEIEKRNPKEDHPIRPKNPKLNETHKPRLNITKRKRVDIESLKVEFVTKQKGDKAPLFEPDQVKDKIIIQWNVDHPFYHQVVAPNAGNPEIFNPLAYLVYCYASAELMTKDNSDSQEICDNIRWEVGRNLSVLLK